MNTTSSFPTTLIEAVRYFADPDVCHQFMLSIRWPDGKIKCPNCGSENIGEIKTRRMLKCRDCEKQFSTKVGSLFEDSPLGLDKWLPAVWLIVNCKNGISSYEVARDLGITQKSAWFMMHRIRLALQHGSFEKMGGGGKTCEVDETAIGGRAHNMHKHKRAKVIKGTGYSGKAVVMGLLERHDGKGKSKVRTKVIGNTTKAILHGVIEENVEKGTAVYTDAWASYRGLSADYEHAFIDHAETYVDGAVHTNGLENFWALLKRSIKGTYVSVEPFHLFRYLDEQAYRFNHRSVEDKDRFMMAMLGIAGKRLTYESLIGEAAKELPPTVV
jgi:transposase-like protein